jgi:ankyrin repeat protein
MGPTLRQGNESEATALHWAADGDHDTVVQLLLGKGPTLWQRMTQERQLYIKQPSTATVTVRLLIEKGAKETRKPLCEKFIVPLWSSSPTTVIVEAPSQSAMEKRE